MAEAGDIAQGASQPSAGPPPAPGRSRRRGAMVMLVGGYANLLLLVVQGLVLVPLYLTQLGSATYGAWMATGDLLAWLAVLDLGIAGVSAQRMSAAHGRGDARAVADYFGTGLLVQGVMVCLLCVAALLASPFVPGWVRLPGPPGVQLAACFAVAALATGLGMLANVVSALATSTQRMVFVNVALFVSGLAGLGTTIVLLVRGYGLWALALGMLVRSGVTLLGVGIHALYVLRQDLGVRPAVRKHVLRDLSGLSAVTILIMVANAAVSRSDAVLIALFYGPETVTVYVLTRRAAEMLSMFMARIGGAVYPGFAHLVGSGETGRAAEVVAQVARLYFWVAVPAVAVYMALNRSFMELWVGPESFAGQSLTVVVGLNVLFVGWSALVLYVSGAAGLIERAGVAMFIEAVVRIVLALALLRVWGLHGLPAAGVATTGVVAHVALGWLYRRLGRPRVAIPWREVGLAAVLLALGAAGGYVRWAASWTEFVAWGALFGCAAGAVTLSLEPLSRGVARRALGRVTGWRA